MLYLRLTWRELRSGDLAGVMLALGLAMVVTSATYAIGVRLESAVLGQASEFLAADRVYRGPERPPGSWFGRAGALQLETALTVEFASMLYSKEERALLVSAKAVSESYPLRGQLESDAGQKGAALGFDPPKSGEIWLDGRLFSALNIAIGDRVELADGSFAATRQLVREPDRASSAGALVPRALIAMSDVADTDAIRPGSRVQWNFLLAGDEPQLEAFDAGMDAQEREGYRLISVHNREAGGSRGVRRTLSYIRLAGTLVLLLSMLAGLLAGRRYFLRQQRRVALLKTLGISGRRLLGLYLAVLGFAGLLVIPPALLAGWLAQHWFGGIMLREFDTVTASPTAGVFILAAAAAVLGLGSALAPGLLAAIRTPPMSLLRSEEHGRGYRSLAVLLPALMLLPLFWLAGSGEQMPMVLAALALILLIAALLSWLLGMTAGGRGGFWLPLKLAQGSWRRRMRFNVLQIFSLALVVFPAATLYGFRVELFSGWDRVLNRELPNFFVSSIRTGELEGLRQGLRNLGSESTSFAPVLRGRWVKLERADGTEAETDLRRSVNISWSEDLPDGNRLASGLWWGDGTVTEIPLSLERDYALRLGAEPGDQLTLLSGGRRLVFEVSSIREVNWLSMTPNFFALTQPGALPDDVAPGAGWMGSFHLPKDRTADLHGLLRLYPAINLFDLNALLEEAEATFGRLAAVVNLLLVLLLAIAALILVETLLFDLVERRRQGSLLRVFGASSGLLVLALGLELAVVGIVSGWAGALGADVLLRLLSAEELQVALAWPVLLLPGLLSAGLLLLLGIPVFRQMLSAPPAQILRGEMV